LFGKNRCNVHPKLFEECRKKNVQKRRCKFSFFFYSNVKKCSKISEKLDDDYNLLKDTFLRTLKAPIIENVITPIKHFHEFLNTNYAFLTRSVITMKETYGKAIKWQTIVMKLVFYIKI